jgi:ribokinase
MRVAHIVGSINMDIVATVKRHPRPGETVIGESVSYLPGGKGANQAVAIARLGGAARMIGRIGKDAFGARMRDFLAGEGIDISVIRTVDDCATGIALITVDSACENCITVIAGANHAWTDQDLELTPEAGDFVVCQLEVPIAVTLAALHRAKAAGAVTVLNPAPYQELAGELMSLTDIIVLNEIELGQMVAATINSANQQELRAAAARLLERGPQTAVVTLGAEGVLVVDGAKALRVPGRHARVVDTTGAGDCFIGALVAELMRASSLEAAAQFANVAASISVERAGAALSIPIRSEVVNLRN